MQDPCLLFMHIPKTAGTTLRGIVERQYSPDELKCLYPPPKAFIDDFLEGPDRENCRAVIGHYGYDLAARMDRPCRFVTFLRDPVELVLSSWLFHLRWHDPEARRITSEAGTLAAYSARTYGRNLQLNYVAGWYSGTARDPDAALKLAKQHLEEDFESVCIVEYFDESMELLSRRLGWEDASYAQRENVTEQRLGVDDLLDEELRIIRQNNAADIELYRFGCELFARQLEQASLPVPEGLAAAASAEPEAISEDRVDYWRLRSEQWRAQAQEWKARSEGFERRLDLSEAESTLFRFARRVRARLFPRDSARH